MTVTQAGRTVLATFTGPITAAAFATNWLHTTGSGGGGNSTATTQATANTLLVSGPSYDENPGGQTWLTNSTPAGITGGTGPIPPGQITGAADTGALTGTFTVDFDSVIDAADFDPSWFQVTPIGGSIPCDVVAQNTPTQLLVTCNYYFGNPISGSTVTLSPSPSYILDGTSATIS